MDSEYDCKFEEMKKYIPFLESMIKRLEITTSGSNPRQAQLEKIKSLRDLLMDKKKRMKMENLLKCEQVLVNLYAKVEQREALPGLKIEDSSHIEKSDFSVVRNKLKSVVSKFPPDPTDTLPEIARASKTEEVCVPGSKEPALFQRRPNLPSPTPDSFPTSKSRESTIPKRVYTRILVSPERSETYWSNDSLSEQPLYSRRSPKKSPSKLSPTYHKKERKKYLKNKSKYDESKDLNITLNVPEDSLNSLNTEDILSRIINCSDGDVDIATLRELRTQILGELKETGANDDISDIILKSYKNKKSKQTKGTEIKSEVEEGEISDSESEAIESIYGSLVVLDKNKSISVENKISDKDQSRKIQICLVINSEKNKSVVQKDKNSCVDTSDFETFNQKDKHRDKMSNLDISGNDERTNVPTNDDKPNISSDLMCIDLIEAGNKEKENLQTEIKVPEETANIEDNQNKVTEESSKNVDVIKPNFYKPLVELDEVKLKSEINNSKDFKQLTVLETSTGSVLTEDIADVKIPLLESKEPILQPSKQVSEIDILQALKKEILSETTNALNTDSTASPLTTPLLHQPKITKVVNAREIGQKKRISIESYKAKATATSTSRYSRGLEDLYIDKNSFKDDNSKKQSLKLTEKECERFNFLSKLTLTESSDDEDKSNLSLDDIYSDFAPKSPDHEDFADTGLKPPVIIPSDPIQVPVVGAESDVDMRKLLNCNVNDVSSTTLLPFNAEKSKVIHSEMCKSDEKIVPPLVDPRVKRDNTSLINMDSLNSQTIIIEKIESPSSNIVTSSVVHQVNMDQTAPTNSTAGCSVVIMTPNLNISSHIPPLFPNMPSSRTLNTAPNVTSNIPMLMTPTRAPNIQNMTPSRTPNIANMTPSLNTFDSEGFSTHEHVYAPMFSDAESRDNMDKSRENHPKQYVSDCQIPFREDRDPRNCSMQRDIDYREPRRDTDYRNQRSHSLRRDVNYRSHSVQRDIDYRDMRNNSVQSGHSFDQREFPTNPSHPFGRVDCPPTPNPSFGRLDCPPTPNPSFGRLDCPPTPNPSFGRLDCPATPNPSFGRLDCPPTPNPSFGRLDCPPTPTPSFGRLDCQPTPTPLFGMIDIPMTPVHPFGRSDCPSTPSHPFGRGESLPAPNFVMSEYPPGSTSQDPRLHRSSDYENYQYRDDERERSYFQEPKFNSGTYNEHQSRDLFRRYQREQSVGRNDRGQNFKSIHTHQEQISRRETSIGRSFNSEDRDHTRSYNRDYEDNRYSRSRSNRGRSYDYRNRNEIRNYEDGSRRCNHREKSVGKKQETGSNPIRDRKSHSKFSDENKFGVNSHGGPSFNIDTSIKSSFQELDTKQKFSASFDARRQRASSVGRALVSSTRPLTLDSYNDTVKNLRNAKNYRRACSVGREVAECKLDFKDIKADLKSYKFRTDYKFSKDKIKQKVTKVPVESSTNFRPHYEQKSIEVNEKLFSNTKYSPRQNHRDPRMCRDTSRERKDDKSNSRNSKNYGIVYTSDNISKGKILGPGYGVKNYKIPKIKRLEEVKETVKKSNDVNEECDKEKDEQNGAQNLSENNLHEKKNSTLLKITKSNDSHNLTDKKELGKDEEKERISIDKNKESETDKNQNENKIVVEHKLRKFKEIKSKDKIDFLDNISKNLEETKKNEINNLNSSNNSFENTERRVTRSARKNMPQESLIVELSPVKRLRKVKKSLVLESDSDENEKFELKPSKTSKTLSQCILQTSDTDNFSKQTLTAKDSEYVNETKTDRKIEPLNVKLNVEKKVDNSVNTVLETSNRESDAKINLVDDMNIENQEVYLSNKETPKLNITTTEKKNNSEDILHTTFSLGDLEILSDDITSDPVIANINALIADLDHDLDSSKNNDANSHFTKELSLETMLENLRGLDKIDKKEPLNVLSLETDESKTNKCNEESNTAANVLECSGNKVENKVAEYADAFLEKSACMKDEDKLQEHISQHEDSPQGSEILTAFEKTKDQSQDINTHSLCFDIESDISNQQLSIRNDDNNKVNIEDACSNDAIVSTSEDGNNFKLEISHENLPDNETANSHSTPDSTINSNVDDVEPKTVVLFKSGCEMISDITSTHVTGAAYKDSETNSSVAETSAEIESIDKLLSILQDKTKIKELLSRLGGQSVENEKIKKKLKNLTEIDSDDENNVMEKSVDIKSSVESANLFEQSDTQALNKDDHALSNRNIQEKEDSVNIEITQDTSIIQKESEEIKSSPEQNEKNNDVAEINAEIISKINVEMSSNHVNEKKSTMKKSGAMEEPSKCEEVVSKIHTTVVDKLPKKKGRRRRGKKRATKAKSLVALTDNSLPKKSVDKPVVKKPSRELKQLQKDIGEMFIKDDVLTATGIRMCRIAKLVDEKKSNEEELIIQRNDPEPLVILNKCNDKTVSERSSEFEQMQKKKNIKSKTKDADANNSTDITINASKIETVLQTETDSKLKEKRRVCSDPYIFESDVKGLNDSDNGNDSSSEYESDSINSSKSFESTEVVGTKKKIKRRRGRLWQTGVIKPKNRKKKLEQKVQVTTSTSTNDVLETDSRKVPDFTCFTDKTYCFRKNILSYNCRICSYSGSDIVHHYKKEHPHTEVALSRLSPAVAKEAIKESENVNFQEISKISSKKYICRFCFKEFGRKKLLLESFFWHIVSSHTGEYKQTCSKCIDTQICPLDIDIPPPPKDTNGQLLGYICEKCNYTQISLENLKTHVIVWHNPEQVAVYTINLGNLSKSAKNYISNSESNSVDLKRRQLRSSRTKSSMIEASDVYSDSSDEIIGPLTKKLGWEVNEIVEASKTSNVKSKLTFESDVTDELSNFDNTETTVKIESDADIQDNHFEEPQPEPEKQNFTQDKIIEKPIQQIISQDILDYPHFKIRYTESGSKEYVCCINGTDNHYKTTLLISMKKHLQLKHSEKWDGYCCFCKVIVTPQGNHKFKDCFQHFFDKHIDDFPVLEETSLTYAEPTGIIENDTSEQFSTNNSYINVRPLSQLIFPSSDPPSTENSGSILPVIESVISLGARVEQPRPSPSYPTTRSEKLETMPQYKYEEFQAEVMSKKHRVVLEAMMSQNKLVHVFKCAGRFCSFTTDRAEDALLHASTHMRVGGVDSLNCVYCDFDSSGNAIDLITHVFKYHGCCPYVCGTCFYRAAASQLVKAHIQRVHDKTPNVDILKTPFQTPAIEEDDVLSRESAVPYYHCCDKSSPDGPCKYRAYTPGKFCEHLETRHSSSTEFLCFICSTSVPTAADLICHLKTHGLKLYQCTWCVFGADNEAELLQHASALHHSRKPKAYLRIITNKEGTTDFRILPLAQLHKSDVPTVEVTPNTQKDFPEREAQRSIELEKLIGHTNFMIESMSTTAQSNDTETEQSAQIISVPKPDETDLELILTKKETIEPRAITPTSAAIEQSEQSTPIIKPQILPTTPEKTQQLESDIVCLDSDDETPPIEENSPESQVVTEILNSNVATPLERELKKVQLTELFVCSKCKMILKCGAGFRKHINACFNGFYNKAIPCAHCPMRILKKNIVAHYNSHHDRSKSMTMRYYCDKCSLGFSNMDQVKEHKIKNHYLAESEQVTPPITRKVPPGPKSRRKRFLENKDKAVEPPQKVKRYGPQDIDKLPINPILEDFVVCSLCEFSTKVRLNMVRHLQLHAQQQPVPQTAPVNPVPHLETNEKHFDKMLNLASSSIGTRATDKNNKSDGNAPLTPSIPPETVSRYPKYVPDKQRLTCGAKDCSYISVDESMLKCHWETLHHGMNDFHCVHCPPYQSLDKSKPVTASRIIAHLKMHDEKLYACSLCSYYHCRRPIVEKHLTDVHKGGQVLMVREGKVGESSVPIAVYATSSRASAPTMDLKPWQCGLCKFKSLLRPEVVDHCAKVHNSKMQFKCAYCAFRTSNPENITKHQAKSHVGKPEEIFYYYYREGSVLDEADGTTRWQKQSQNTVVSEPRVKSENPSDVPTSSLQNILPARKPATPTVDLNMVKKEVESINESLDDLCKEFGAFCEPNGLKYKCSLCNNGIDDSAEAMQSHLYEELKYRKWGCSICSYKAFHKEGLSEHMVTEHGQNRDPIALPVDYRVETWVTQLLEYQTSLITKYKDNLAKQKEEILRTTPGPSTAKSQPKQVEISTKTLNKTNTINTAELEKAFGPFGASVNLNFCCPKCESTFKEQDAMHNHLESELNRIRWYCSNCLMKFQTYHEAQFHSRSVHVGQGARPVEVIRDPSVRAAWIDAVIKAQKVTIDCEQTWKSKEKTSHQVEELYDQQENSLLVVRYEEMVQTPEEVMRRTRATTMDSDDEKLIIDEPLVNRKVRTLEKCPHCNFTNYNAGAMRSHVLKHYELKPFTCPYCNINGMRKTIEKHQKISHPTRPINLVQTTIPVEPPNEYLKKHAKAPSDGAVTKVICLICRNYFTEAESQAHTHDDVLSSFGKKGDVVVQCNACRTLQEDVTSYLKHHKSVHPQLAIDYVFSKLNTNSIQSKELLYACGYCQQKFPTLRDMKIHLESSHSAAMKYTLVPKHSVSSDMNTCDVNDPLKRKSDDDSILPPCKRTARKSTTKLPNSVSTFARKSTTKLPFNVRCETEEYSYYGTKPSYEGLHGVVTMMPFYNKMVPFTFDKLKDIINIDPAVRVEKVKV